MSQKKKRQELEAPDAFQRTGGEITEWLASKQKYFYALVIVVAAFFLVAAIVHATGHKEDSKAAQALSSALATLQRPVAEPPAKGTPGDDQAFATEKDKDQAVVSSLEAFRKKFPGTDAATTAALTLGQAQLRLGQYDAALASFEEFLKNRPGQDPLRAVALEGKGYAYEAKNQLDQAMAAYAQLADSKGSLLSGMGLYHEARIEILQNKKQEAAKLLSQIPIEFPQSAAAKLAQDRLDTLAAEGVKPPAVTAAATPGKGS